MIARKKERKKEIYPDRPVSNPQIKVNRTIKMSCFLRLELSGSVNRHDDEQRRQWVACQKEGAAI